MPRQRGSSGPTIRYRIFELLKGAPPEGYSATEIRQALGIRSEGGVGRILRDESCCTKPRLECLAPVEGELGRRYRLTQAGAQALRKGIVDSAQPRRALWSGLEERIEMFAE